MEISAATFSSTLIDSAGRTQDVHTNERAVIQTRLIRSQWIAISKSHGSFQVSLSIAFYVLKASCATMRSKSRKRLLSASDLLSTGLCVRLDNVGSFSGGQYRHTYDRDNAECAMVEEGSFASRHPDVYHAKQLLHDRSLHRPWFASERNEQQHKRWEILCLTDIGSRMGYPRC